MNLTKSQIQESLGRLKDYSYWMYYEKNCKNLLAKQIITYDSHKFSLSVTDYSLIRMRLENGIEALYDAQIVTAPPQNGSIDNVNIQVRIMNKSDLSEEYLKYFTKASVFISSFFQRAVAFTFFSRMADGTIDGISNDLIQYNK